MGQPLPRFALALQRKEPLVLQGVLRQAGQGEGGTEPQTNQNDGPLHPKRAQGYTLAQVLENGERARRLRRNGVDRQLQRDALKKQHPNSPQLQVPSRFFFFLCNPFDVS